MGANVWTQLKELGRDTAVYGSAEVLLRVFTLLLSIVTVPIFTRVFTLADYGFMELLGNTASFLFPLLSLTLDQVLMMLYYEEKETAERISLCATGFYLMAAWSVLLTAGLVAAARPVAALLAGRSDAWPLFAVVFVSTALTSFAAYGKALLRLTFQPVLYSLITVLSTLAASLAGLICVVVFGARLLGVFSAGLAVNAVAAAAALYAIRAWLATRPRRRMAGRYMALAPALLGSSILMTLNALTDRYFLMRHGGLEAMGVYSLAFRFSAILTMAFLWISMTWTPLVFKTYHEDRELNPLLEKVFHYLFSAFFVIGFCVAAFSRQALHLLTPPPFHAAYGSVAPLCLAAIYSALFLVSSVGLQVRKRVRLVFALAAVQFAVNVAMNAALVPRFGAPGAAAATAVANLAYLLLTMPVTVRILRAPFLVRPKILATFGAFSLLIAGLPFFRPDSVRLDLVCKVGVLPLMGAALFAARILTLEDVAMFRRFAGKFFDRLLRMAGRSE